MNAVRAFFASLLMAIVCCGQSIRVGAAISLREAITQIAADYEAQNHVHVELVFGSSGQIQAQIENGAPIDAFISAANSQVDQLTAKGLVLPETRRVVAGNKMVLVVPASAKDSPTDFPSLADPKYPHISIGEPKTVPAGDYAMQVLKSLQLDQKLKDKLIYGANVRQVLSYVERGEVAAGLVYQTDAMESGPAVKVVATAPESTHEPIVYPAVVIKASKQSAQATQFLDYLATTPAMAVLSKQGFTPAPQSSTKPGP